jgi:hypothetical protein
MLDSRKTDTTIETRRRQRLSVLNANFILEAEIK